MYSREDQYEQIASDLSKNGYSVLDDFLSTRELAAILQLDEFVRDDSLFKKAAIGRQIGKKINENIRGDYIHWIDPDAVPGALNIYLGRLRELMAYINRNLFLSLKDFELHLTRYPAGSYYQRHLDQFKGNDHRKLSVIFYLNQDWTVEQGGQLRMYLPHGPVDILPVAGRLVCFRSEAIEHEVLPATRDRLSVTGWMMDQLSDVRFV